jgi:hypothetical protein
MSRKDFLLTLVAHVFVIFAWLYLSKLVAFVIVLVTSFGFMLCTQHLLLIVRELTSLTNQAIQFVNKLNSNSISQERGYDA